MDETVYLVWDVFCILGSIVLGNQLYSESACVCVSIAITSVAACKCQTSL